MNMIPPQGIGAVRLFSKGTAPISLWEIVSMMNTRPDENVQGVRLTRCRPSERRTRAELLREERVVCERNRDPSRTTTPAGGLRL